MTSQLLSQSNAVSGKGWNFQGRGGVPAAGRGR